MDDVQTVAWRSKSYAPWMDAPNWAWAFTANEHDVTPDHEPLVLRSNYASLAERVRELEADAARYRWLRDHPAFGYMDQSGAYVKIETNGVVSKFLHSDSLDSAIDAAMQDGALAREG